MSFGWGCGCACVWSFREESCGGFIEGRAKCSFAFFLPNLSLLGYAQPIYLGHAARTMREDSEKVWYGMVRYVIYELIIDHRKNFFLFSNMDKSVLCRV